MDTSACSLLPPPIPASSVWHPLPWTPSTVAAGHWDPERLGGLHPLEMLQTPAETALAGLSLSRAWAQRPPEALANSTARRAYNHSRALQHCLVLTHFCVISAGNELRWTNQFSLCLLLLPINPTSGRSSRISVTSDPAGDRWRSQEANGTTGKGFQLWGHHSSAAHPSLMLSHILFFTAAGSQVPVADDDPGVMKAKQENREASLVFVLHFRESCLAPFQRLI